MGSESSPTHRNQLARGSRALSLAPWRITRMSVSSMQRALRRCNPFQHATVMAWPASSCPCHSSSGSPCVLASLRLPALSILARRTPLARLGGSGPIEDPLAFDAQELVTGQVCRRQQKGSTGTPAIRGHNRTAGPVRQELSQLGGGHFDGALVAGNTRLIEYAGPTACLLW